MRPKNLATHEGRSREQVLGLQACQRHRSSAQLAVFFSNSSPITPFQAVKDLAVDIQAIRAEARQAGYAEAREIVELCALAGMSAKAAGLLVRGATPAEARQFLLEARAAEDAPEIHSHVMPDTGTSAKPSLDNNPVVKAAEQLAAAGKGAK